MSFLEKKIKENKDFFDHQRPSEGHQARFIKKLEQGEKDEIKSGNRFMFLRLAAVGLILVAASWFLFQLSFEDLTGAVYREVRRINFSNELENVFAYYDAITVSKINEIDKMAANDQQAQRLKVIARKQIEKIDANLAEIEKEYAKNPNNERLREALVNSKRMKAQVMDNILKQLDEVNQNQETGNMNP